MIGFFENNRKASFYLRDTAAENCYCKIGFFYKYIGLTKNILRDYGNRIVFAGNDYQIATDIYLIPHKTANLEQIGKRERMYRKIERKQIPDNYSHEQSLVFDTDKGLVIFNSCSHGGAANIINEVAYTFPDKKVYAMVGGFHLFGKPDAAVRKLATEIAETGISCIYTGHCSGERAYRVMKEILGEKLHQLHVGLKMEF